MKVRDVRLSLKHIEEEEAKSIDRLCQATKRGADLPTNIVLVRRETKKQCVWRGL